MKKSAKFTFAFIAMFLAVPIFSARAATLYLSPSGGEYEVSRTILVDVLLNSSGEPINAVDVSIAYPTDLLEVKSVSKSKSILSLWPKEPVYSNGRLSFSGGVPAPGFNGTGNNLTISFLAKKEGEARLAITDGLVLAADGRGTNVLASRSGAVFAIKPRSSPDVAPIVPEKTPGSVSVSSSTHPDQAKWYNDANPVFEWKNPSGTKNVSYSFDKESASSPDRDPENMVESVKYENVSSGIWYFHIKTQNESGWGRVSGFKVRIDSEPPKDFEIRADNEGDPTNPNPALYFLAEDERSGISHYEIKIDDSDTSSAALSETDPYKLPLLFPGKHEVSVNAVDNAGNRKLSKTVFDVSSIPIPEITAYSSTYNAGDEILYIEGSAIPDATVILYFEKKGKTERIWEINSDGGGNWKFSAEELFKSGTYEIFAKTKDKRGALSYPSEKKKIDVVLKGIAIGTYLIDYWSLVVILILLIALIILIIFLYISRIKKEKKKLMKETREAEESLKKTFQQMRTQLEKKIEYLDLKPGLSLKEKKIRDEVFELLKDSEKIVGKEIKDIEDELKR